MATILAHEERVRNYSSPDPPYIPPCFILTFQGKEYNGYYKPKKNLVEIVSSNGEVQQSEVSYEWKYGSDDLDTMIDGDYTLTKLLKRNYDSFEILFNCATVSFFF